MLGYTRVGAVTVGTQHRPDVDLARQAGLGDVFAHGMLSMAYLGRFLTDWIPQSSLRNFSTCFVAITRLHEKIVCTGRVAEKLQVDGELQARLEIQASNQHGEVKLAGEAIVKIAE